MTHSTSITYKGIRRAINRGEMDEAWLDQWQVSYSRLVNRRIIPAMHRAAEAAAAELQERYEGFVFDLDTTSIADWAEQHCGKLISQVFADQRSAVANLVSFAARFGQENDGYTVDELSRFIRPCIGLSGRYSKAVSNFFAQRVKDGIENEKALRMTQAYADRLKRSRAMLIARTELAYAYNYGTHEATRQAVEQGYLPQQKKVWSTADDERVCPLCGELDGTECGFDDEFDFNISARARAENLSSRIPPAHPGCRCVVMYKNAED